MSKYSVRILTIESHTFAQLLREYYPFRFYKYIAESLPISGRIHEEFHKLNISFDEVICFSLSVKYCNRNIGCYSTLHKFSKATLNGAHWRALFANLITCSYNSYIAIFCDCSVHGERAGWGVSSEIFKIKARIPDRCFILTA